MTYECLLDVSPFLKSGTAAALECYAGLMDVFSHVCYVHPTSVQWHSGPVTLKVAGGYATDVAVPTCDILL